MPRKILVVDDERVIADTLAVILRGSGYEVAAAYDAQGALRQCACATPDLVISDVLMPGMNGVELAEAIQQHYPSCKILLFSGQAASADLLGEARRRGHYFELLQKPIHPKDLLAKVGKVTEARAAKARLLPQGSEAAD